VHITFVECDAMCTPVGRKQRKRPAPAPQTTGGSAPSGGGVPGDGSSALDSGN